MKTFLIILLSIRAITVAAQQTFTVTSSGNQFSPVVINANVGDNITFSVGSFHPILQVEEATYNANGKTAFAGGFAFPSGSGTFTPTQAGTIYYVCTNHISSGMKGKIIVSKATAVEKISSLSEFEVYPNPAIDYLYLKSLGNSVPVSASVYDMSGKKLLQNDIRNSEYNQNSVFVSELRKGLYFITVRYSDKTYTRKFFKQ